MIVMTILLSIFNQMEFHLVQNRKKPHHNDHISFNLKENIIFFCECRWDFHNSKLAKINLVIGIRKGASTPATYRAPMTRRIAQWLYFIYPEITSFPIKIKYLAYDFWNVFQMYIKSNISVNTQYDLYFWWIIFYE